MDSHNKYPNPEINNNESNVNNAGRDVVFADKTLDVNIYEVRLSEVANEMKDSMGNKKKISKNTKRQKPLGINWFFWIGTTIIAIPVAVFLWLLLVAANEGSTPVIKDRFIGDLDPKIEVSQVETLTNSIQSMAGVEKCTINLIVATMRISVDASDSLTSKEISDLTVKIYEKVNELLPVVDYFTNKDTHLQYDLEINVYNDLAKEDDFIMYSIVKNSPMEKYILHDVSTPLNPELARELWEDVEERKRKEAEAEEAKKNGTDTEETKDDEAEDAEGTEGAEGAEAAE